MENFNKEVLTAYVRGIFSMSENTCSQYVDYTEQLPGIMDEHGIDYVDHRCCDGFCPDCEQTHNCEAYEEIKDGWEGLYT